MFKVVYIVRKTVRLIWELPLWGYLKIGVQCWVDFSRDIDCYDINNGICWPVCHADGVTNRRFHGNSLLNMLKALLIPDSDTKN